jgi:hypothetical protein
MPLSGISLWIFIVLLAACGAYFLVSLANANRVKEPIRLIVVFSLFIVSLSSYMRSGFGYDYYSYMLLYDNLLDCGCYSKGPLFFALLMPFKFIGLSFDAALALISFLSIAFLSAAVNRVVSGQFLFPFIVIISLYFFVSLMGQIRQFLAISIAAYAVLNVNNGKVSFATYLASILIHPSLLIFFPAYYFFRTSLFPNIYFILAGLSVGFLLGYIGIVFKVIPLFFDIPVLGLYAGKFASYHQNWVSSGVSFAMLTVVITQFIFILAHKLIAKDALSRRLYVISLTGAVFVFLLYQDSHIYGRVIKIFRVFDFLLIFRILYVERNLRGAGFVYTVIAFFAMVFLFKDYLRLQDI